MPKRKSVKSNDNFLKSKILELGNKAVIIYFSESNTFNYFVTNYPDDFDFLTVSIKSLNYLHNLNVLIYRCIDNDFML